MEIVVDDRERAIFGYLEDCSHNSHINYKIQRNEVGDYAIMYKGYILLIIERKTWEDLSASLRDGRKENVHKLIALREKTGCQIGYLIEGDATPPFDKRFGRLPLKYLRSHLDHLSFRDGIHMFYSRNIEYTAKRLFELAQNYLTLKDTIKEIDDMEVAAVISVTKNTDGGSVVDIPHIGNDDELKKKQVSGTAVNEQLLRCIPGIGSIISATLSEAGVTISQLYMGLLTVDYLAGLKYNSGAVIGAEKARKILKIKSIIDSNSETSKKVKVNLLSCIPLISKATAIKIVEMVDLGSIIAGTIDLDVLTKLNKTEKAKLGPKAAGNIIKWLSIVDYAVDRGVKVVSKSSTNKGNTKAIPSKPADKSDSNPVEYIEDEHTDEDILASEMLNEFLDGYLDDHLVNSEDSNIDIVIDDIEDKSSNPVIYLKKTKSK